jgi:predicted homoserine dehydrogenase-like protein
MYKPCHLMGLELGISVLSGALRGEPTEQPQGWRGDVVAVAKRELSAGETLDGEGGYTVWGTLAPAEHSLAHGALPIGLASHVELQRDRGRHDRVLGRRRDAGQRATLGDLAKLVRQHFPRLGTRARPRARGGGKSKAVAGG